ncbi:MAG: lipoate--protein ligase family protein [Leptonema sp. (in: Bacteria)]|nr:lipoate--protein ligase family protein [Leptonema sp. (in: bacteria)]
MILEIPDLKIRNPYLALGIEDAIAEYTGAHYRELGVTGFFRFWSNSHTIVLGRTCDIQSNVSQDYLQKFRPSMDPRIWKNQPMIARRISGGGTVLHGPGNINFSFFLPIDEFQDLYPVRHSYEVFLGMVIQSLELQGIETAMKGMSDLVLDPTGGQKKISGNAQFRKYGMIVHHGTLLVQKDIISLISKFLNHPPTEPEYRKNRSHDKFLVSLPESFDLSGFYNSLLSQFKKFTKTESMICPPVIRHEIIQKGKQKAKQLYSNTDWILNGHFSLVGAK